MSRLSWWRLAIDSIVLIILFVLSQFVFARIEPYQKAGFYCNDYSVNLPYTASTVTNLVLCVISILLPFVFIVGTELLRTILIKANRTRLTCRKPILYTINLCCLGDRNVPEALGNICTNYGVFLLGLCTTNLLTNLSKVVIGRLRPNFLSVCQPAVNPYELCGPSRFYLVPGVDFQCKNPDLAEVMGVRKSFPSGHSSLAFYAMIFLCLFIRKTWNFRTLGFFKYLMQVLLASLAVFTALSRVQDNKHHPSDVLAGSAIGVVLAVLSFVVLRKYLNLRDYKCEYKLLEENKYEVGNNDSQLSSDNAHNEREMRQTVYS